MSQQNAEAQNNVGVNYANGEGVPQDHHRAVKLFRQAANQGLADAQSNLGLMYTSGEGVPEDRNEAMKLFRQAANQGLADAQNNLGLMHTIGEGVREDHKEATKWFHLAADQGHAEAQYNLGVAYDNGLGVPEDHKETLKWYRLAANQGYAAAQYNLGVMYRNGEEIPEDDKEAVKWFRLAADQGYASAQYNLGPRRAESTCVPEDNQLGYRWSSIVRENGFSVDKTRSLITSRVAQADTPEEQRMASQGTTAPTPKDVQQYIFVHGYAAAVKKFSEVVIEKIPNRNLAYLFILEELDGARQGNEYAMGYAKNSGINPAEYVGALEASNSAVDSPNGPQQTLLRLAIALMEDRELAAKFKCDVGDEVMRHFGIGAYDPSYKLREFRFETYQEAAVWARRNPGSVVTRSSDGSCYIPKSTSDLAQAQ
ncbi:MAG: tetratricopeptide repeat protein [Pseudomonadales bacterium]|nr:tetratricopeptide repeat protein [Pseudomonadales bacterium]